MTYSKVKTLKFSLQLLTLFALVITSVNLLHCGATKKELLFALSQEATLVQSMPEVVSKVSLLWRKIKRQYELDEQRISRLYNISDAFERPSSDADEERYGTSFSLIPLRLRLLEMDVIHLKREKLFESLDLLETRISAVLDNIKERVKTICRQLIKINRAQLVKCHKVTEEESNATTLGTHPLEKRFVRILRKNVYDTLYNSDLLDSSNLRMDYRNFSKLTPRTEGQRKIQQKVSLHKKLVDSEWINNWLVSGPGFWDSPTWYAWRAAYAKKGPLLYLEENELTQLTNLQLKLKDQRINDRVMMREIKEKLGTLENSRYHLEIIRSSTDCVFGPDQNLVKYVSSASKMSYLKGIKTDLSDDWMGLKKFIHYCFCCRCQFNRSNLFLARSRSRHYDIKGEFRAMYY